MPERAAIEAPIGVQGQVTIESKSHYWRDETELRF